MNKLTAGIVLLFSAMTSYAASGVCLPFGEAQTRPTHVATLQAGAKLYFNYCAACHSLQYMRYSRIAQDLDLTEAEVTGSLIFTDAKIGDYVTNNMPAGSKTTKGALDWFGQAPPDLSLTARSRGVNWIYNYLKSFYADPTRPVGWNNLTFPGASMPNPLWELQGLQQFHAAKDGAHAATTSDAAHASDPACSPQTLSVLNAGTRSASQFDADMLALTSFLEYVGEPAAIQREHYGIWVLLYLVVLTLLLYLVKNEYWKDIH